MAMSENEDYYCEYCECESESDHDADCIQAERDKLQTQLEAAREVIEFYADHRNWFEDRNKERTSIDNCDIDFQKIKGEYIEMEGIFGGKRARAYLEKWGKG
jgi:hypothetical protein